MKRMKRTAVNVLLASTIAALVATSAPAAVGAPSSPVEDPSQQPTSADETGQNSLSLPFGDEPDIMIGAHRGQWRDYPENSIPAVLQATEDGAEIIEIDLKRTQDGHLVLMHDETVDRTTNGTGRVDEMTLEEIKTLSLRAGQGNGPAEVTDLRIPTFEEALEATRGHNVLLNLDKGWGYRDQLVEELRAAGMEDYALFKGAPNAQEANEFMAENPEFQYMHIINDDQVDDFTEFTTYMPEAIEIAFDSPEDAQADPDYWKVIDAKTDVWANSMWDSVSGGYTDEASLRDPDLGWQYFADHGIDAIQTDDVRMINAWREGIDVTTVGMKRHSMRLQAEDFIDDPAFYHDTNERNECGDRAIRNPDSPVDACDLDGAHVVQYIRQGEHFTLEVEVDKPGKYNLSLRHSADTEPGGTVTVDTGDAANEPVHLPNTTHNRAFTVTDLGKHHFSKGTHQIKLEFTHPDYMSVDWLQLDRGRFVDHGLLR